RIGIVLPSCRKRCTIARPFSLGRPRSTIARSTGYSCAWNRPSAPSADWSTRYPSASSWRASPARSAASSSMSSSRMLSERAGALHGLSAGRVDQDHLDFTLRGDHLDPPHRPAGGLGLLHRQHPPAAEPL